LFVFALKRTRDKKSGKGTKAKNNELRRNCDEKLEAGSELKVNLGTFRKKHKEARRVVKRQQTQEAEHEQ
jgi:hypothetical protein